MIIRDPSTGRGVRVNEEGHLEITAISFSGEHHVNHAHGEAYNVLFEQAPTANDDCIFYMYNDSATDLIVEGVTLAVSNACEVYLKTKNQGTRNSATALTPINLNSGSGKEAEGTFEKGADLDGGAATLTAGDEIERFKFTAANESSHFNFEQDIILPKGYTLTIWCDTLAITVLGTVVFNYHSGELG